MTFFGLKQGQDLENRAAHPHQEFPGVPAWGKRLLRGLPSGSIVCLKPLSQRKTSRAPR